MLDLGWKNFQKLNDYIDSLSTPEQEQEFPKGTLNRNIRDVLAHLHEWHLMMMEWYSVGMAGKKPDMPAKGFNWRTCPQLNEQIQEQYSTMELEEARELLAASFHQVRELIMKHNNEELFEKKQYKWTGSTSMGYYFASATSSRYDSALKLIRRCRRNLKQGAVMAATTL